MQGDDLTIKSPGHTVTFRPGVRETILILTAIACYNAVELLVLIPCTFRQRRGLYFWSLLLSNCLGVLPLALANAIFLFASPGTPLFNALVSPAMLVMVTGQSLVLYSRLHLVVYDKRILRGVLYMIIASCVLLQIPSIVFATGYIYSKRHPSPKSNNAPAYLTLYKIMGKISATGISLQETIISSLYIWETVKMIRLNRGPSSSCIMRQLIAINVLMIVMDVMTVLLEYANMWYLKMTVMAAFDSIKLKLEFAVLRKLVEFVQAHRRPTVIENALCPLEPELSIPVGTAHVSLPSDLQSVRLRDTGGL